MCDYIFSAALAVNAFIRTFLTLISSAFQKVGSGRETLHHCVGGAAHQLPHGAHVRSKGGPERTMVGARVESDQKRI